MIDQQCLNELGYQSVPVRVQYILKELYLAGGNLKADEDERLFVDVEMPQWMHEELTLHKRLVVVMVIASSCLADIIIGRAMSTSKGVTQ